MQEEEEHLAKYGKQVFQNKNFQMKGAIGLTVIFRNLLLNEFEDKEKIIGAFLEKYLDYQNYKTETLGMRGQLKGGVYGNYLKLIKTPDYPPKEIEFEKYTGGVDYGTITDNTTAFLNGMTSRKQNPLTAQIEAHMDIWTLCGVDIPQDTKLARPEGHDYAQANKILDFYEQASKVYPDIIRKKVVIYVDRTALAFHDILNREAKSRGMT